MSYVIARRTFSAEIRGEMIPVAAGERIAGDHEIVRAYPGSFEAEPAASGDARMRDEGREYDRPSLGDELEIRHARVRELRAQEREARARTSREVEEAFWGRVDHMLTPSRSPAERAEDAVYAEAQRLIDEMDAERRGDEVDFDRRSWGWTE